MRTDSSNKNSTSVVIMCSLKVLPRKRENVFLAGRRLYAKIYVEFTVSEARRESGRKTAAVTY